MFRTFYLRIGHVCRPLLLVYVINSGKARSLLVKLIERSTVRTYSYIRCVWYNLSFYECDCIGKLGSSARVSGDVEYSLVGYGLELGILYRRRYTCGLNAETIQ